MTRTALLSALVFAAAAAAPAAPVIAQDIRTYGDCSPVFSRSPVGGSVTVNCGANNAEIRRLQSMLTTTIRQTRMNQAQTDALLEAVNANVAANTRAIEAITERLVALENVIRPDVVINDIQGLLTPTSGDPAVGYIDEIRFDILSVDVRPGGVVITFQAWNQGISERSISLQAAGANRRGSRLTARGQVVHATSIEWAGQTRSGGIRGRLTPGVPLQGRITFGGVHVDPGDISMFELGWANNNMAAQDYVVFRFR